MNSHYRKNASRPSTPGLTRAAKAVPAAGRRSACVLDLLERRLLLSNSVPQFANSVVQFKAAAETVNASAGTFSIPVNLFSQVFPTVSAVASGLNMPRGLAFDPFGNLYVADSGNNTVVKVTLGGTVSNVGSGFDGPTGVAFDTSGNLYVVNSGNNTVSKVTPQGAVSTFASGFHQPTALAFDASGTLFVGNFGDNTVVKVTPDGTVSPFAALLGGPLAGGPLALAFDASGILYVGGGGKVSKVTAGGTVSMFAENFGFPAGLAFDTFGNLYVADGGSNSVRKVTPGGMVTLFTSGLDQPTGLTSDASGNLYVCASGTNTLSKITTSASVPFTLGGTAVAGVDYSGVTSSPLMIPDYGPTSTTITGTLLPDAGPSQTLTFTLGTPDANVVVGSNSVNTLTIIEPNPAPMLSGVSPNTATAGSANATITLTGTGFIGASTADFNGAPIATTFVSATQETAVIPAADLATAAVDSITVVTPGPGGGTSAAQTFTVDPAPVTLASAADAYVRDGAASDTNFGSAPDLQVKDATPEQGTGFIRNTYLRFDLTGQSPITSAVLELHGSESSTVAEPYVAVSVYGISASNFPQSGITFDNAPGIDGPKLATFDVSGTAKVYSLDLTSYVRQLQLAGVTTLSLALTGVTKTGAYADFASSNAPTAASVGPMLLLNGPGVTPTPTPTSTQFAATAGAFVRDGNFADTHFDASQGLQVKQATPGTGYTRVSYIRFDLSALNSASTIDSALLNLSGSVSASDPSFRVDVDAVAGTFDPGTITYDNAPAKGSLIASALVNSQSPGTYTFDLSNYVRQQIAAGQSQVTIALVGHSVTGPFASLNGADGSSHQPLLTVVSE